MNVLLLEPNYSNKYPPLGLMKLAYYHKEMRKDFVWFQKGELPDAITALVTKKMNSSKYYTQKYGCVAEHISEVNSVIKNKSWDRIYITTLFTFEWDKTIQMIEYAKTLVPKDKIFVGGILATLMASELESATGVKPTLGLLTCSSMIGVDDCVSIDTVVPDYSILENIEYSYPDGDAYFTSCTKGCGMKCSFCAVQILEPDYQPYIPITEQIKAINERYGERRHLLLMDNNVLKSPYFNKIIEDIISAGFGKGATRINPKSGKPNLRYVDFNQGLDSNLLTKSKCMLLNKIALSPVHIAFDHIDEKEKYVRALTVAEENGLNNLSNLMLFNTPEFKGKGTSRRADTPQDLYERIKINVEFAEKVIKKRERLGLPKFQSYSFPMQFIPLGAKTRDFLGDNWTPKTYQAVKRMIHISKGVVYSRKAFFESIWGENVKEFSTRLLLPKLFIEECLSASVSVSSNNTRNKNFEKTNLWLDVLHEWNWLYKLLNQKERGELFQLIKNNTYTVERFISIKSPRIRRIYIHYFTSTAFVGFLEKLKSMSPLLFDEAVEYLNSSGKIILTANKLQLSKLSCGEGYIGKLNNLTCTESTAIALKLTAQK